MADFSTCAVPTCGLDPNKRVNYPLGLVLGVDELEQEQFYFLNRGRQHNRVLHGYGTVCGLHVETDGTRVIVRAGLALSPRGKVIHVQGDQCADVNDWLQDAGNRKQLGGTGPGKTLYVLLRYRECRSDNVPVPGAPCRSEDDSMAPSRIAETYELGLSAQLPLPGEEEAVRCFGELLRQIEITDAASPGDSLTVAEMEDWVRKLLTFASPPPGCHITSPLSGQKLRLHPADAEQVLRAGLRVWVTEVHPTLMSCATQAPSGSADCSTTADEEWVQLASVNFDVLPGWQVSPLRTPQLGVDQSERPYLVSTRVLQELLLLGLGEIAVDSSGAVAGNTVTSETSFGQAPNPGSSPRYARADHTHGTPAAAAGGAEPNPATAVASETTFGQAPVVGTSTEYARADHSHGTPAAPPASPAIQPGNTVIGETTFGQASNPGASNNYARADHTHGTPAAPAPGGPAIDPGNSVVSETTFGQASTPGTAGTCSRSDHTHGTPPTPILPQPSTTVVAETGFSQVSNVGSAPSFARGDHTHGTPPAPTVPQASGTVVGETTFGQISNAGSAATFARGDHTHGTPPAPNVRADFVIRPGDVKTYAIVAAGVVPGDGSPGTPPDQLNCEGLVVKPVTDGTIVVTFNNYVRPDGKFIYIVKAMAGSNDKVDDANITFRGFDNNGILLNVRNRGQVIKQADLAGLIFVVEVSRFDRS